MDDQSTNIRLPYLIPDQAQKHVTVNESLGILDDLILLTIQSSDLTTPPANPIAGQRYIVADNATADWAGRETQIAVFRDEAWGFHIPDAGWTAWNIENSEMIFFDGSQWAAISTSINSLEQLQSLGIGTQASSSNPFSAKLNNALFAAKDVSDGGSGDMRLALNKETSSNILSLLFQSAWVGKAEIGLAGNDSLAFRTSSDGNSFLDALVMDNSTGIVDFPQGIQSSSINNGPLAGFRNLVINGNFSIAERTLSSIVSNRPAAIDRWYYFGGVCEISRQDLPPGELETFPCSSHFARFDVQTKANWQGFAQRIENVTTLANSTATLSFHIRAQTATQFHVYIFQNFGTNGSPQLTLPPFVSQPVSTSWQKVSFTTTFPSIAGKTIDTNSHIIMVIYANAGSPDQDGYFDIANVQLEPGSAPSPMEYRPPAIEQALCRRYFRKMDVFVPDSQAQLGIINMRSAPTITGGGTGFSPNGTTANSLIASQATGAIQTLSLDAEL